MRTESGAFRHVVAMVLIISGVAAQAVADDLISEGLPPGSYSASSVYDYHLPELSFDGGGLVVESTWVAMDHAGWIEVDLGESRHIARIRLTLHMSPEGRAAYRVWLASAPMQGDFASATLIDTFAGNHVDGEVLETVLPSPEAARYVAVETSDSVAWAAWYEVQVFAADEPILQVSGTCPGGGRIEVSWSDATPNGQCSLIFALDQGSFLIPAQYPCQGTLLGLGSNQIQLVGTYRSDADGARAIRGFAGDGACGAFLQLIDLTSCDTSNVAPIE